jgi:hypothetical protein
LTEIDSLDAEWLTDVQIGDNPKVYTEFYQPLNADRTWFVAPSARIESSDLPVYQNDVEVADFRMRQAEADLDFGRELGNWGEIRGGFTASTARRACVSATRIWSSAVQRRRVFLQVQLRPPRQRAFSARRPDLLAAMGCRSQNLGLERELGQGSRPIG